MIDIDRYEGHDNWEGTKVNMANEANKLLIADAPLLLAEVKRLREAFIIAVRHVGEHDLSRDDLFSKLDEDLFSLWLFRSE